MLGNAIKEALLSGFSIVESHGELSREELLFAELERYGRPLTGRGQRLGIDTLEPLPGWRRIPAR